MAQLSFTLNAAHDLQGPHYPLLLRACMQDRSVFPIKLTVHLVSGSGEDSMWVLACMHACANLHAAYMHTDPLASCLP